MCVCASYIYLDSELKPDRYTLYTNNVLVSSHQECLIIKKQVLNSIFLLAFGVNVTIYT